ncbi:unnamed protein product, partial [Polarella glacialis]
AFPTGDLDYKVPVLFIRSACRAWDSPALLAAVWAAAALSSVAVLSQHQRLAEAQGHFGGRSVAAGVSFLPLRSLGSGGASLVAAPVVVSARSEDTKRSIADASSDCPPLGKEALRQLGQAAQPKVRRQAMLALLRIASNLKDFPNAVQYRLIWKENAVFQQALGRLPGNERAMRALGFSDSEAHETWQFRRSEGDQQMLEAALSELRREEEAAVASIAAAGG